MNGFHQPVLVEEVVHHLVTREDGVYIDGTLGTGGHAQAILEHLNERGRLLGIDRDETALGKARERLARFGLRCLFLHGSYEDLEAAGRLLGTRQVDGILLDLGVSSMQIDQPERGFSFAKEATLDMRMDARETTTAQEILLKSSRQTLEKILREFGEESFASPIASALVEERRRKKIQTTTELASLVARVIPRKAWPRRLHPATRTFQALRIAVNRELERLDHFLSGVPDYLVLGGRLAVISYHSLEDRRVKNAFVQRAKEGILKRVTKKPVIPSDQEVGENRRARSAKLRVAERVDGSISVRGME